MKTGIITKAASDNHYEMKYQAQKLAQAELRGGNIYSKELKKEILTAMSIGIKMSKNNCEELHRIKAKLGWHRIFDQMRDIVAKASAKENRATQKWKNTRSMIACSED